MIKLKKKFSVLFILICFCGIRYTFGRSDNNDALPDERTHRVIIGGKNSNLIIINDAELENGQLSEIKKIREETRVSVIQNYLASENEWVARNAVIRLGELWQLGGEGILMSMWDNISSNRYSQVVVNDPIVKIPLVGLLLNKSENYHHLLSYLLSNVNSDSDTVRRDLAHIFRDIKNDDVVSALLTLVVDENSQIANSAKAALENQARLGNMNTIEMKLKGLLENSGNLSPNHREKYFYLFDYYSQRERICEKDKSGKIDCILRLKN